MTKKDLEECTKKERIMLKTERKQKRAAEQDLPDFMENAVQEKCP